MTIREQVKLVETALQEWAKGNGGRVFIAADALDCIEQLRMRPGKATAAVLWQTEEPRGDVDILGRVDRGFKAVVSRGRGLKLQPGESLTDGTSGGEPMFDLVEQVREIVLALRLDDDALPQEDQVPTYKGTGPFEVNGTLLDASEVRFGLAAQITQQAQ